MNITVNSKSIEVDDQGFLLNSDEWSEDVGLELVKQHEAAGHKKVTETGWMLVKFFREFHDENMRHPHMNELIRMRSKLDGKDFEKEEHDYKTFLYELFPHGPIRMLAKLAGLSQVSIAQEVTGG